MKLKNKVFILLLGILVCLISNQVMAIEYYEIDDVDRFDVITKAFSTWMENFKKEDMPENKRILDYQIRAVGTSESNENKIRATVEFTITPVVKENTQWNYTEELETRVIDGRELKEAYDGNICFLEMTKVNGQYQVDYIAETPKGYDAFLARFEEYKKNLPETVTTQTIQTQDIEPNQFHPEIERMSHIIVVVCLLVLVVMISLFLIKFLLYRKKHHSFMIKR